MKNFNYIKRALQLFKNNKKRIALIVVIFASLTAISMLLPFITEGLVDKGFALKDFRSIVIYSISFFVLYLLFSLLTILKESVRLKIYNDVKRNLREMSLRHLLKIRLNYFSKNNPANIYQFIEEDIGGIAGIVGEETLSVVSSLLIAVGGCISLCAISWKLSLLLALYIPLKYAITRFLSIRNAVFTKFYIDNSKEYSEWFGDFINGIKEVRYFNLGKKKTIEFDEKQDKVIKSDYKRMMLGSINEESQTMLIQVLMTVIYIIAGIILLYDGISLGGIIAFEAYALMIASPISDALNIVYDISSLMPSIVRFFDFMDEPEEKEGEISNSETYDIKFSGVSFSYDDEHNVIEDISFDAYAGEKVAIIGNNGVGKTTLINLLLRAISPMSGTISIGGTNIDSFSMEFYRSIISVVSQNVFLFNDTIRNNICLEKEISDDELEDVIGKVNLRSLIEEKTLDYIVGQNGSLLSGGQKQKIAIARALVHKAPILILDEATSNLDQESIDIVNTLINEELKDITVICITHETRIIENFDKVYRLNDGKVNLV